MFIFFHIIVDFHAEGPFSCVMANGREISSCLQKHHFLLLLYFFSYISYLSFLFCFAAYFPLLPLLTLHILFSSHFTCSMTLANSIYTSNISMFLLCSFLYWAPGWNMYLLSIPPRYLINNSKSQHLKLVFSSSCRIHSLFWVIPTHSSQKPRIPQTSPFSHLLYHTIQWSLSFMYPYI